ncbi:MAG: hypothetical protein ABIF84_02235, partial [Patescibacteria group bacterium]
MDKKMQKQFEKKLEEEKKKLTKDLKTFAKKDPRRKGNWLTRLPFLGNDRSHKDESAERIEAYETLLPIEQSLELSLQKIEAALEKIKKGSYGICETCKKEIDPRR